MMQLFKLTAPSSAREMAAETAARAVTRWPK